MQLVLRARPLAISIRKNKADPHGNLLVEGRGDRKPPTRRAGDKAVF